METSSQPRQACLIQPYGGALVDLLVSGGALFPIPITLLVDRRALASIGDRVALRDARNNLMAVMEIAEVFSWDPQTEAGLALGTTDLRHPLVSEMSRWGEVCISGPLKVVG